MDIHYSPVTCLKYVPDPNTDLIPGLYQVADSKPSKKTASKKVIVKEFLYFPEDICWVGL